MSVCIPLVIEDPSSKLHTEIILTSASFAGIAGYADRDHSTDYEIALYDSAGTLRRKPLLLSVPAMRTSVINCGDLLAGRGSLTGGMVIRMLAKGKQPTHVGDLFSAAFVRWNLADSFDTLHAHPDPLQFQVPGRFYSSMPFPSLEEFTCTLSLFNPYDSASSGRILLFAGDGQQQVEQPYHLTPHAMTLFNLNSAALTADHKSIVTRRVCAHRGIARGGSIAIENAESKVKNFAYLMIKGKTGNALAAEHTIHQGNYPIKRGAQPFGPGQSFKARGWLYSAFAFKNTALGGLNLSSRVYLSAGRPLEDEMWMLAYATDAEGTVHWSTRNADELNALLPSSFLSQGAIKLAPFQSCDFDLERLSLRSGFAGGIGIATSPQTSHVLMKMEVRVHNWSTGAFTHFRPGSGAARALQAIKAREGLATDYIVSGVRLRRSASGAQNDCLLGVLNMEQERTGEPAIEVFDRGGFVTRKKLSPLPGWGCRHVLSSELFGDLADRGAGPLTLRLIDSNAALILSALHIDYARRDVAIDHGSDRFSTYLDYGCQ